MSVYYSRFYLNTYAATPYFQAQVPVDLPWRAMLQKNHAFRRLPPNLKELAGLAKRWAIRKYPEYPAGQEDIERFYDTQGYELDSSTGRRLTDAEIDAQWQPNPSLPGSLLVMDIPKPPGGFPDPDTWEEPEQAEEKDEPTTKQLLEKGDPSTIKRLLREITSHGEERVSDTYDIPIDQLPTSTTPDLTFDEAKAHFNKRLKAVLASSYLKQRPAERKILVSILPSVDIYDDLWGDAEVIFDKAEASLS